MMKLTFNNYAEAEAELNAHGFKHEAGMPLYGVRFFDGKEYRFVFRMADNEYEITRPYPADQQEFYMLIKTPISGLMLERKSILSSETYCFHSREAVATKFSELAKKAGFREAVAFEEFDDYYQAYQKSVFSALQYEIVILKQTFQDK